MIPHTSFIGYSDVLVIVVIIRPKYLCPQRYQYSQLRPYLQEQMWTDYTELTIINQSVALKIFGCHAGDRKNVLHTTRPQLKNFVEN